jgi:hypothetical protein
MPDEGAGGASALPFELTEKYKKHIENHKHLYGNLTNFIN